MIIIILYPSYMGVQITAIAVVNTFYAFFAAISQSLIGVFLQLGQKIEHSQGYSIHDYQISLIRLPVYLLIALIFSFFIKKTCCKQVTSSTD